MSLTKRMSPDGVGNTSEDEEFWDGYGCWLESLPPVSDEDLDAMYEDFRTRILPTLNQDKGELPF